MNKKMIKWLALALALGNAAAAFAGNAAVGVIEFSEGSYSLTRAGAILTSVDIGDEVQNFDLLKTGADGRVIIKLYPASGMSGTLTVKTKSVFSIKTETMNGAPQTEGNLIGGQVAVKVQKIAGVPGLRIRTGSTVMGVRGTQFDVAMSVNDALLVTCAEGRVACSDDQGTELEAVPGQAVEQKAQERLRRVPVAVSNLAAFQNQWIADEITAFSAAPLQALAQYAKMYRRYREEFRTAYAALAELAELATWLSEYKRGVEPRSNDVAVMKQKSAVAPKLMAVRTVLFLFERVYYRLDEIRSLVGDSMLNRQLESGKTVNDFYRELTAERSELERKTAMYRFAVLLFAERNEGREPSSLSDEGDEDFFDKADDFFD